MTCAQIRRREHDVGPLLGWQGAEPPSERDGLAFSQLGERNINVPELEIDHRLAGFERGVARDPGTARNAAQRIDRARDALWRQVRCKTRRDPALSTWRRDATA